MSNWTLDSAPRELNELARDGWLSDTTAEPAVGDIWLLTWDGRPQALALVTSVFADYIRAMPVTLGIDKATRSEAILPDHILGTAATIWFHAETGLGRFLLHRRIVNAVALDIRAMREAAYSGAAARFVTGTANESDAAFERLRVLDLFQTLCFIEWPALVAGEAQLDSVALRRFGIDGVQFVELSGLSTAAAFEIWTGGRPLPVATAVQIADVLGIEQSEFLRPADDLSVALLNSVQLKGLISAIASQTTQDERQVRNRARSSFALAARTSNVTGRELIALTEALRDQLTRGVDDEPSED
jgi:hypothetical protein